MNESMMNGMDDSAPERKEVDLVAIRKAAEKQKRLNEKEANKDKFPKAPWDTTE